MKRLGVYTIMLMFMIGRSPAAVAKEQIAIGPRCAGPDPVAQVNLSRQ